ncbi:Beta-fimbriae probable major subunit [Pseudomonas orientalis]|uniref:DUF1120 domain-containing protein n=1 Tax=Pseudomonas orientalis TaxID=76758 RepID=UPI000F57B85E|nr:DUF1120 domain-containing protein [Pseudomonas orientalis]AZE93162.1 Beta-fimbriae probable major subunit [Pseudomonas orientalis]AZE98514.1 Beta-fimbriae probable major subunit [Pseudomonas orientalis]
MNTTSLSLLSGALLLALTSSAFAASSVDLTVKGLITPSACTPGMPGDVDFGKIAAKDLDPDKYTWLERRTVTLNVNCDAATLFAVKPVDNRAGTEIFANAFGLGLINQTEKLGAFQLSFSNPVAETPSTLLRQRADGTWTDILDDEGVVPNDLVALGSRADTGWAPHPLKDVSMDITLYTAIAPANKLTLTGEVAIDGSATLEVVYL